MVKLIYYKCYILVFITLFSSLCFPSPQLVLITDKTESEIGRPVRVEVYAIDIKHKLSKINLSPLYKDFGVETEYSTDGTTDTRWPNQSIQVLNLKIYPRRTGNLKIPALQLNKYISKENVLKINSGTSATVPEVLISDKTPYTRQQFILQFSLYSKHSSSRLTINESEKIAGFESNALKFKRIKQNDGRYLLTTGWVLSALNKESQSISLPPIEYSVSGVLRKKYYIPAQQVRIKNLPSYLPPTIPVGKISIHSQLSKKTLIRTGSVIYWQLQLVGNLSNPYRLPPVLRQVKSNEDIKIFPINSNREKIISSEDLISTVTHSIPLKTLRSGYVSLPGIQTQYFEPETGKIIKIQLAQQHVFAANLFIQLILYIIGILLVVLISNKLYKLWQQDNYCRQQRKNAIKILQGELNTHTIRQAINSLSKAEGWPDNISLTQWKIFWSEKYNTDSEFTTLLHNISKILYAKDKTVLEDISVTANKLIRVIKNRRYNNKYYNFELPSFNL